MNNPSHPSSPINQITHGLQPTSPAGERSNPNSKLPIMLPPKRSVAAIADMVLQGKKLDPLDMVLPGLLAGDVGMLIAAGATGKSMLALQMGISLAAGEDLFGLLAKLSTSCSPVSYQQPVLYINNEDQGTSIDRRLYAIWSMLKPLLGDRFEQVKTKVDQNFDIRSLADLGADAKLICRDSERGPLKASAMFEQVAECADKLKARLLLIDTFRRSHSGSENDEAEMIDVLGVFEQFAAKGNCSVLLSHHTSKAARNRPDGPEATDNRGSSVLVDNVRLQISMAVMSKSQGNLHGFDKDSAKDQSHRKRWVQVVLTKANHAEVGEEVWMKRVEGGVLRVAEPPPRKAKNAKASDANSSMKAPSGLKGGIYK